jgi:hypothetical protein
LTLGFGGGVVMALGYGVAVNLGGFDSGHVGWGLALWPPFGFSDFCRWKEENKFKIILRGVIVK